MSFEELKNRLNQLIEKGERVLVTKSGNRVDDSLFHQWRVNSLSFLSNVFGNDSIHFQEFHKYCRSALHIFAVQSQSILKAAKEDLEGGYLKKIEDLVSADIFTDFLEMAEYLLEQGYKDPAASLTGAVLEDGLRKIAKNNKIKLKSRENIVSLNQKITDAKVYNRLTQKRVQVWNDVRDNADHGNFSAYDSTLVKEMLDGVRGFLEKYL